MTRRFWLVLLLAILAAATFWLFSADMGSAVTMPALCCVWFFAGLVAMGRVRGLRTAQLVLVVLGAVITVGVGIWYVAATPPDSTGAVAVVALFVICAAQAVLGRRERLPQA